MSETPFSNREISLLFKNLESKLDTLLESVKNTNLNSDKRFQEIESDMQIMKTDIRSLQDFKVKALALWTVVTTIGATLGSFILNRYL
jgi:hypothetical protein